MRIARRLLIGLAALALLPAMASAQRPALRPDDMTLGKPKARVVIVEYASLSCPHCARFHRDVFPALKTKYIDSGKVLFVYREFVTSPVEVAVPATILARCAAPKDYFTVIAKVFDAQEQIYRDGTVPGLLKTLKGIGASVGIDEARFEACLNDQAAFDALKARIARAQADGVDSTPTLMVNGRKVAPPATGEMDLASLEKAIAAAK
ncbi:MAG: DsbA family protein [Pseudomonadota bacterium]